MAYIRGKPEIRSHPRDISLRHQRTSAIFHRRTWGVGRSKTPLTQIPQNSPCPLPYHGHMAISHIAPLLIYLPTINAQNGGFSTLTPVKWSNIVEILQFERFCWYSDCHTCMVSTSIYYVFEASMIFFFQFVPLRSVVSTAFSRSFCTSLLFKKCFSFEVVCCKTVVPWQFEVAVFSFGLLWLMERCSIKSVS